MNPRLYITGVDWAIRAIGKQTSKDKINIAEGLKKAALTILKKSQQYVPVDTGLLKKSGQIEVTGSGMGARAAVLYQTRYAIYVHEDLSKYHAPPTQAKFLERAVRETRGITKKLVGRELEIGRAT